MCNAYIIQSSNKFNIKYIDKGCDSLKTEREKMSGGEMFFNGDPQLMEDKRTARTLVEQYNHSNEEEVEFRNHILHKIFGSCGEKIFIKPPFHCDYGYNIHLGENFFANFDCVLLDAAQIHIGKNCFMGPKVCIYAVGHPMDVETRNSGIALPAEVHIGNNVWIGGGTSILPGVNIGDNVVIGAASVVTKNVPENAVVVGNPARVIKILECNEIRGDI